MSNEAPLSDHRWEGIATHDHARLHNGHIYGQVNSMYDQLENVSLVTEYADMVGYIYTTTRRASQAQQGQALTQKENGEQTY